MRKVKHENGTSKMRTKRDRCKRIEGKRTIVSRGFMRAYRIGPNKIEGNSVRRKSERNNCSVRKEERKDRVNGLGWPVVSSHSTV